ncbi:hypothetical protein FKB34_15515 [Glycocaulis profundi]|nr:hypothetical protein FKB34_15515 [Glycocaulis profundi]
MTAKPSGSTARLRDDIDTGRARDKVAHPDPAAAPLGTDDEASDAGLTDSDADLARFEEAVRRTEAAPPLHDRGHGRLGPFLLVLASVVIAIASLIVLSL